jgi:integrase
MFAHDGVSEVPPPGLLGPSHRRTSPYIYSEEEVVKLLGAAGELAPSDSLRPATFATLFGLLASTGLRISEAIALIRADVDLADGVLMIRRTKFRKSRYVPLDPSVTDSLARYETFRNRKIPTTPHEAFFLPQDGEPLSYRLTRTAFEWIRRRLGWTTRMPRTPRIHDLRHTFACRRILLWHEQGVDVDVAIPSLSTYLGHAKVTDTYWYLTGFQELMAWTAKRFERYAAGELEVS